MTESIAEQVFIILFPEVATGLSGQNMAAAVLHAAMHKGTCKETFIFIKVYSQSHAVVSGAVFVNSQDLLGFVKLSHIP